MITISATTNYNSYHFIYSSSDYAIDIVSFLYLIFIYKFTFFFNSIIFQSHFLKHLFIKLVLFWFCEYYKKEAEQLEEQKSFRNITFQRNKWQC